MTLASLTDVFGLSGHHALITGGGSGLGLATARCFLAAGARVTIVGTNATKLEAAGADLGGDVATAVFDVRATQDAEAFAAGIESRHGPVSILVNNAGNTVKKPLDAMTVADFEQVLDIHVVGAFALSKAFVGQIERVGRGSILFTASMASYIGMPNVIGYNAAKSAYLGLVRGLAAELSPRGIRVNAVAPGWIDTPMYRFATDHDPARRAKILGRIPAGRVGEPADIGWAMTYLASPAAAYVSGHVLVVDGGALHAL